MARQGCIADYTSGQRGIITTMDHRKEGFVPRKLTLEIILAVKEHLARGVDLEGVSALCLVSLETMKAWQRDGQARMDEWPDKSMEEWLEEGIYTPPLNVAIIQGLVGATKRDYAIR